jgi:cephalosporin-C deacetylase-like acetyl esterase
MKFIFRFIFIATVFFQASNTVAQPVQQIVSIVIAPNHENWQYKTGEMAIFSIRVLYNGNPLKTTKIICQIGAERMKPIQLDTLVLKDGIYTTKGITLSEPGFLRCIVSTEFEGRVYRNLSTVGFSIETIVPTVNRPADFDNFWDKAKMELATIPMDSKITLLQEKCSALTNVYQVNLQSYGASRLYGILCVPKKPGKYPAILQVPGAGIRPYNPDLELADKGFIVFSIGIHGIPVNLEPSVYNDLNAGALKGYFFFNANNKDKFYYKRVYMGCIRANDFIVSLPEFDGENLAVTGNSQGGALSIVTASLDKRVKYLAAIHPALCDLTGYFKNRAGGWPHFFDNNNLPLYNNKEVINTLSYYDVVNFAKTLKTEGYYTWGFNDETCPPTSMYAAYNSINAPKSTAVYLETGHWFYPEQKAKLNKWLMAKLLK